MSQSLDAFLELIVFFSRIQPLHLDMAMLNFKNKLQSFQDNQHGSSPNPIQVLYFINMQIWLSPASHHPTHARLLIIG